MRKYLILCVSMFVLMCLVACSNNDQLEGRYEVGANDPENFQAIFTFDENGGFSVDSPSEAEILNERGTYEILEDDREDGKQVITFNNIIFNNVKIYAGRGSTWLYDSKNMTLEEAREDKDTYTSAGEYCEKEENYCSDEDYILYLSKE